MRSYVPLPLLLLSLAACADPAPGPRVSADGVPPARATPERATGEQLARRARSVQRLRAEGVPVLESLPVIEAESACRFRTRDEIVDRAVALFAVASRGAGDPEDVVRSIVDDYGASAHYSPLERRLMSSTSPAPEELSAFSWRFEALVVLLWALGYRDALPAPTAPTSGIEIAETIRSRTLAELRESAVVRPRGEILDQADLVYRYHWAVVDARLEGRPPPAGLSPDVVMEWHQALNWLIGYQGAAWDDVPTDT